MQPDAATANYNIEVLGKFKAKRFQDSVANNPYFYCKSLNETSENVN